MHFRISKKIDRHEQFWKVEQIYEFGTFCETFQFTKEQKKNQKKIK